MEFKKIISGNLGDDTLDIIFLDKKQKKETINLINLFEESKFRCIQDLADRLGPIDLCLDKYGELVLVNTFDDSIFKIDLQKRQLKEMVKVGRSPVNIKIYKDNIYILNSDSNAISIVDNETFKLIENINIGENPVDMNIDRINNNIYTSNLLSSSINVISIKEKWNKNIGLKSQPRKIVLDENKIYVLTNLIGEDSGYSSIEEFGSRDNKFIKAYNIKGIFYNFLKLQGEEIFFLINSKDGYLYKLDIIENIIEKYIYIGGLSSKLICVDKEKLYINNLIKDEIILINIIEGKIKDKIKVGKEPHGFILL